eukprot:scaffold64632_cov25-Prasinocladus_malaysianus.AAC.1
MLTAPIMRSALFWLGVFWADRFVGQKQPQQRKRAKDAAGCGIACGQRTVEASEACCFPGEVQAWNLGGWIEPVLVHLWVEVGRGPLQPIASTLCSPRDEMKK